MKSNRFMNRYVYNGVRRVNVEGEQAGDNLSWRAIFAGVVTFLAVCLLFIFVGAAIGLGLTTPTAAEPFAGVTTGMVIWLVVTLILAFALAGFVTGVTANRAGFIHGFLTWALGLILLFMLAFSSISSAFSVIGNVLGRTGDAVGSVVQTTGEAVGNLTQEAFDNIVGSENVNTDELQATVKDVLRDTEIPELQPNYLQGQLDATTEDAKTAAYNIFVNGSDAEKEIKTLTDRIQGRVEKVGNKIDHDALVNAVSNNTELSKSEADAAVKNIEEGYDKAAAQTKTALEDAEKKVNDLTEQAKQTAQDAVVVAEDVTNQGAKYSLLLFVGLLIAMAITSYTAYLGSKAVDEHYELLEK